MALLFPRVAHNFAKAGYYPTDNETLKRLLPALSTHLANEPCRILDPCAGEGTAIAQIAEALNRQQTQIYAVEYDTARAKQAKNVTDVCLRSDFFDTVISPQTFGLLFLNPPYGDVTQEHRALSRYKGKGRPRLEKLFYQSALPLLQYGGVLVLIIPLTLLDGELSTWLSNHFTDLQVYEAVDKQFKQIVIMGVRTRAKDLKSADKKRALEQLQSLIDRQSLPKELPVCWDSSPYRVPAVVSPLTHFYRISIEPLQFAAEIKRLKGLWPDFMALMSYRQTEKRRPLTKMSDWHLALALASGEITGVVTSKNGRCFAIKGDTYKEKREVIEHEVDEENHVTEKIIRTDKFVPIIKAWDLTEGSMTKGQLLTISSLPPEIENFIEPEPEPEPEPEFVTQSDISQRGLVPLFDLGQIFATPGIHDLNENGIDFRPYLNRHLSGDWQEMNADDKRANQRAVKHADNGKLIYDRVLSSYELNEDTKIWIISE